MRLFQALLLLLLAAGPASAQFGAYQMFHHWDFRPADAAEDWGRAEVPGNLHLDLLREGIIPHPFAKTNEDSLQWIHQQDWSYRSHLHITDSMLAMGHAELVFEGLDTYADVYANGAHILRADNAFREWVIPAGDWLQAGHNSVEIVFHAPGKQEERLRRKTGVDLPGGNRAYSRKPAYHDGWDWAPRYRTMGIWKNAYFRTWNRARITDLHYQVDSFTAGTGPERQHASGKHWPGRAFEPDTAWVTALVDIESDGSYAFRLRFGDQLPASAHIVSLSPGKQSLAIPIAIPRPELWWTWDLAPSGESPALYRAAAFLEDPATGQAMDQNRQNIGLRTVELVQTADTIQGQAGSSFFFRINGLPIYARGANWVPTSSFVFGFVPDYLRLLEDARNSNINMLRVWGGGTYEWDVFYDWCSRNGILVWQDFPFACSMVPGETIGLPAFTENVRIEANQQIRRLRRYPALALWCGNNESAEGWARWGWQDSLKKKTIQHLQADYDNLFQNLLPGLTTELSPHVSYIPSSPLHGRGDPRYLHEGDAHDWWVWHDGRPFEHYQTAVPRFMSEFGFQAYPDVRTIAAWRGGGSLIFDAADPFFQVHQKHPRGAQVIENFLHDAFGESLPDSLYDYVYLSQWLQADGMGKAIEAQRRGRPRSMGTLYWQFNDVWPAVSWSGIDVDGRWKVMQHRVRESYRPVALSAWRDTIANWRVAVVNDSREAADLVWEIKIWSASGEPLYDAAAFKRARPGTTTPIWSAHPDVLPLLTRPDIVLHAEIREMGQTVSSATLLPALPKDYPLEESGITWQVETRADGWPQVRLRCEHPALGVWLQTPYEGRFSKNGFNLMPGQEAVADLKAPFGRKPGWNVEIPDPEIFLKSFRVMSLGDVLPREAVPVKTDEP